ncbi:c-type cytochrome [Extensimonas vulgaris]|uniref:Cbb3-type cytochrome c oxidase subunit III n=1 Tax=Extensimonas vulgaris TaxID=1031594 RepID=A0A369ALK4_9BURK|nr:cytochrome c [Extensimonas vulgaris]RCX09047.1 cbb3-type cytochrome c oxidase subunit III [Extensimonas vulgaris]TWI37283.1 cbb3-type cytochrome c oxidase subunit III [Extensimonas vulgaris]TXD14235.1 cytochrome c [Extensimonas vulgaris]
MDMLGMYPTFYVPAIGTAWVMGIIGVIHVLASHTSVGASFLFALLETKAYRENKPQLLDFVRKYGMFLLVFSYIIGSITGPGIWYAITVASPRGVSGLIHNFVWVWAAEWVYFTVEVIGVYALVYLIGKVDAKTHLKLSWSFALASWATMLLIVGILSFMMWPGHENWYQTGSTNDAFYNINFFAHLGTRTGSMFVMATVVGLMVASRIKDMQLRRSVVRFLTPIGLVGGLFAVMMFLYYLQTLPSNAVVMLNAYLLPSYAQGMVAVFVVATLWLLFAWWQPQHIYTSLAVVLFVFIALVGVWPEERMRESMRKPYVAGQYIYGNQVIARDVPGKGIAGEVDRIAEKGLLKLHPFMPERLRVIDDSNRLEAGRLLTQVACANCHALERGAPLRNIPDKFHGATDEDLIAAYLEGPLKFGMQPYMPRIDLPPEEVRAIAHYLATVNSGQNVDRLIAERRQAAAKVAMQKE